MKDPARTLLGEIEREVAGLPGASLAPPASTDASARFAGVMGAAAPPGLAAFLASHDGGALGPDVKLFSLDEAARRRQRPARTAGPVEWPAGLWPVMERGGRRFALDAQDASADGEWPVVEVGDRGVDRMGTSFLRFVHVVCAELGAGGSVEGAAAVALGEERCRRDPGHADHWLDLAELLEHAGREAEIDGVLASALRASTPPTPALLLAVGMRAARAGDWESALRGFSDAIALEPIGARDDDARLDAAALVFVLASERGDTAAAAEAKRVLGPAVAATVSFWRSEALTGAASDAPTVAGELAQRIVLALEPADPDVPRLRAHAGSADMRAALRRLRSAREALDQGRAIEAAREARAALATPEVAELGAAHAVLAECLNAVRDRGAIEAASRAVAINPLLVDGWRELGDAHLEADALRDAETAFRRVVAMDPTYGLGFAKLAQVLLEEGRTLEALEAITEAGERGGDPFFIAAIRGDIYAEMERHTEAAEAYDEALDIEPEDHWALHQAAIEHCHAGNPSRASALFEAALEHDGDGCHQTLVDYADHLRKLGRIGDAVKLYRRAVAAVPGEPDWKQALKDAERELLAAPN
ncbi:MAG TPA: tetratricopeptide repeat protein [Polyangia bacterium]|nr:tetratricopeptide repeat protein [Polyangia bacterium]